MKPILDEYPWAKTGQFIFCKMKYNNCCPQPTNKACFSHFSNILSIDRVIVLKKIKKINIPKT